MKNLVHTARESVDRRSVPWLWPGRIAQGRLILIDGDPGIGKSLLTLDLAARASSGQKLPDGSGPSDPMSVLLLDCGEDNVEDTVIPRLAAARADLSRIHIWPEDGDSTPEFPEWLDDLREAIEETDARLVVFDPFVAFLGAEAAGLNEATARRVLAPLAQLAFERTATFLLVRHLAKSNPGDEARHRGMGSPAILAAVRTAFLLAKDPADPQRRVLACTKHFGPFPPSLAFRIVSGETEQAARLDWLGPVEYDADDLLHPHGRRGEAVPRAIAFLREQLASGPKDRHELVQTAHEQKITLRTLERAKAELGVRSVPRRQHGENVWFWQLPGRNDIAASIDVSVPRKGCPPEPSVARRLAKLQRGGRH